MVQINLADVPDKGDSLEDYVAALFQSAGYFVEKNVTERDPADILELDVVCTHYSGEGGFSVIAEAKGGKNWGYNELFKLAGWMRYLSIDRAALLTIHPCDHPEALGERAGRLNISVVTFGDFANAIATFEAAGFGTPRAEELDLWRLGYWVERDLIARVTQERRSRPESIGPKYVLEYLRLINDGIFFAADPVQRLHMLYDAFKSHPKLTAAVAAELDSGVFNPNPTQLSPRITSAMRGGKEPFIQACLFIEHRARLAMIKCAVDICQNHDHLLTTSPSADFDWQRLSFEWLPATFRSAVEWLREQHDYPKFPLFWQQFLWLWGGFVVENRCAAEYHAMAELAGMDPESVPAALEAFDRFFPTYGGWFRTPGPTDAKRIMLMPTYFHGIGALTRLHSYEPLEYGQLGVSPYTARDLSNWHNATVYFLAGEL